LCCLFSFFEDFAFFETSNSQIWPFWTSISASKFYKTDPRINAWIPCNYPPGTSRRWKGDFLSLISSLEELGQVEMRLVDRDGDRLRLVVGGVHWVVDHDVDVVAVIAIVVVDVAVDSWVTHV